MAKKIIGIYKITCKKNGKIYIGQSTDIKQRFNQHRTQTSNKNLKADMKLYGIDGFVFETLEECIVEELTARENYYLDTLKPEYNILLEGQTVFVSDETRARQRKAKLGKKLTPEHCKKIAISNTGKKISEEACRKHFKAVRCIETGQIFDSIQQAADFVGINYNSISAAAHGRNQSSAGFHWEFVDKEKESSRPKRPVKEVSDDTRKKHCKAVRCVETGQIFESIGAAAKFAGVKQPNISSVLYGKQTTAGGYHWEFVDSESKCADETSKNLSLGRIGSKHSDETIAKLSTPVRCVETGEIFSSIKIAAASSGAKATNISKVLLGQRLTAAGFHWEYVNGQPPQQNVRKSHREGKAVCCIETQEVFRTISEAAAHFGIVHSSIGHVLAGRANTAGGYHWEFYTA